MKLKKLVYFRFVSFIFLLCLVWAGLSISYLITEPQAHFTPDYEKTDITGILEKSKLDEQDYKILFYQTGLGKTAVDEIISSSGNPAARLVEFQDNFFAEINYNCSPNTIVSNEEHVIDKDGRIISGTGLAPLHNGYVLVTSCSHCYGWRNGHAAIVVDEQENFTLESVVLGTKSKYRDAQHWETFANFMVLKLKDASQEQLDEIADLAQKNLVNIPYDLTVGILKPKNQKAGEVTATHCSHLVWQAFYYVGDDVDSDGGLIITPNDIANSELFEIVQIYGMDPDQWWP